MAAWTAVVLLVTLGIAAINATTNSSHQQERSAGPYPTEEEMLPPPPNPYPVKFPGSYPAPPPPPAPPMPIQRPPYPRPVIRLPEDAVPSYVVAPSPPQRPPAYYYYPAVMTTPPPPPPTSTPVRYPYFPPVEAKPVVLEQLMPYKEPTTSSRPSYVYPMYPARPSTPVARPTYPSYPKPQYEKPGDLTDSIPGTPGKDYPVYASVPETYYRCDGSHPGFYADVEARCQVWHYCQSSGRHDSFLCPNGTLFNQKYFVCDWWYNVDCDEATKLYSLNDNLYKVPATSQQPPKFYRPYYPPEPTTPTAPSPYWPQGPYEQQPEFVDIDYRNKGY